ncbi:mannosyl-oligosaccharide glucosidase-like isoform X2 [Anneissia japonica]|uniref:mannosyl-oligosaccharide glucosidase-like isoform X1 n=1 Tax=Anneissia japonica TaxID=1529436 RepID=UPI0014259918|nr:mannosyl-oligosaccharide glucosidase-like isoform X1 [Anneissia japonica]XP_033105350.1 mannosyl-oligosaccharide glucosidase-like isoform X2 [Anneissia japonica]
MNAVKSPYGLHWQSTSTENIDVLDESRPSNFGTELSESEGISCTHFEEPQSDWNTGSSGNINAENLQELDSNNELIETNIIDNFSASVGTEMARKRHVQGPSGSKKTEDTSVNNVNNGCINEGGISQHRSSKQKGTLSAKSNIRSLIFVVLILGILSIVFYTWYTYQLAAMVSTPLNVPKVIGNSKNNNKHMLGSQKGSNDRFWGTYRPGVYFGMRTRSPNSLVTGLMWFKQFATRKNFAVRHSCEHSDELPKYGWLMHDGVNFGVQEIVEKEFTLMTEFVKRPGGDHGGDWSVRISGKNTTRKSNASVVSVLFYAALDGDGSMQYKTNGGSYLQEIHGVTNELGQFSLKFLNSKSTISTHFLSTYSPSIHVLKDVVTRTGLRSYPFKGGKQIIGLVGDVLEKNQVTDFKPNFMVHQVTLPLPFEVEVVFESASFIQRPNQLSGSVFSQELIRYRTKYDQDFDTKFGLVKKGYSLKEMKISKAILSNLIGGIGYFYGSSIVKSRYTGKPVDYWESALYTAVPSRSFFPRGFLWDEGFHNLLISQWNPDISMDIIGHWLDLMNIEGWIPREQILGEEARSKVPDEFVVQNNENANPPTLFLSIQSILRTIDSKAESSRQFISRIYPRLKVWYNWYNTTQSGPVKSSYRWRGRDPTTDRELNPKTLTSGLDDFPRASHPSNSERHIDLRCWMALASGIMADLAKEVGDPSTEYKATYDLLTDNALLDKLHWSPSKKMYSDFGNHTKAVFLQRTQPPPPPKPQPGKRIPPPPKMPKVRIVKGTPPKEMFVDTLGYVSLFPFLLQVLKPDSDKLGKVLMDIKDPNLLWTKYGLRSLSKSDPLYMKYNTEHDPPYWRGTIWINMNFLAVRALYHYSNTEGPHSDAAWQLYQELRQNLITNILKQYDMSGYVWEHYSDVNGKGQGTHPFTGWTSLVVLMMAERY